RPLVAAADEDYVDIIECETCWRSERSLVLEHQKEKWKWLRLLDLLARPNRNCIVIPCTHDGINIIAVIIGNQSEEVPGGAICFWRSAHRFSFGASEGGSSG